MLSTVLRSTTCGLRARLAPSHLPSTDMSIINARRGRNLHDEAEYRQPQEQEQCLGALLSKRRSSTRTRRIQLVSFLLVAIMALFIPPASASVGDRLPEFKECVEVCSTYLHTVLPPPKSHTDPSLSLSNRSASAKTVALTWSITHLYVCRPSFSLTHLPPPFIPP